MNPVGIVLDPLYGDLRVGSPLDSLVSSPIVQRLRNIRLSNIDSLNMPGIAGITRYEHALGTMHLAGQTPIARRLDESGRLVLLAAALLHDSAIPPFGHLVEEAFTLSGHAYHHEEKWGQLKGGVDEHLGGAYALQLLVGRHPGLREWCARVFGESSASAAIDRILDTIHGRGEFAGVVNSDQVDLDNLDNVSRMAFHMGLRAGGGLPEAVARGMEPGPNGGVVYANEAIDSVRQWTELRTEVYSRLMPAPADFVGKVMLLYAVSRAMRSGEVSAEDWLITDFQLIQRLLRSRDSFVADTTKRWLCAELWEMLGMWWFTSNPPNLSALPEVNETVSSWGGPAFCYRIKDKRHRLVTATNQAGESVSMGRKSASWLLGVVTSAPHRWPAASRRNLLERLSDVFHADPLPQGSECNAAPSPLLAFRRT